MKNFNQVDILELDETSIFNSKNCFYNNRIMFKWYNLFKFYNNPHFPSFIHPTLKQTVGFIFIFRQTPFSICFICSKWLLLLQGSDRIFSENQKLWVKKSDFESKTRIFLKTRFYSIDFMMEN